MSNELATLYQDDTFIVKAQLVEGNPFIHVSVLEFSLDVMKRMKEVWEDIKVGFYYEGYDALYAVSPNHKFSKVMGGELQSTLEDGKGVYKWENL
tara:strand:+ start:89 stop:373 length:285 start_codon:yes stop_codon:yes gene_type:complete